MPSIACGNLAMASARVRVKEPRSDHGAKGVTRDSDLGQVGSKAQGQDGRIIKIWL
jgi:hypothetical protein